MTTDKQRDKQQAERDALTCVSNANVRQAFEKCQIDFFETLPDEATALYYEIAAHALEFGYEAALQSQDVQKLVEAAKLVVRMEDVTEPHEYDALHEALQPFTKG